MIPDSDLNSISGRECSTKISVLYGNMALLDCIETRL
jgi:hypothetical protein